MGDKGDMAEKPIFHLQPKQFWMNDPNGMCFIGGMFHMFYQHNPFSAVWGNMTWGHAISPDMVHWRRLPNALHPDMPYDKDGVFSGCCVVREGIPHILYTGVYPETLCLAKGDAQGMVFEKHADNPILTRGERKLAGWRDPYVWRQDGVYNMLIGSGDEDGGFAESYRSKDLLQWESRELFAHSKDCGGINYYDDKMWECPVFFYNDSGDAALIVSAAPKAVTRLFVGRLDGRRFTDCIPRMLDLGDCLYAPNIVRHPDGRWILFGWQRETGDAEKRAAQGWQGMLTLPRELRLDGGRFYVSPAREIDSLRGRRLLHYEGECPPVAEMAIKPHYEIEARLRAGNGRAIFSLLSAGAGGSDCNADDAGSNNGGISSGVGDNPSGDYNAFVNFKISDGRIALTNGYAPHTANNPMLPKISKNNEHHIRIFVDGTSIEAYIDSRYSLTTRAYPPVAAGCLRVSAEKGCEINMLDVYEMNDCYENADEYR